MARTLVRLLPVLGWIALASLAFPVSSSTPAPDAWSGRAYPAMAGTGCIKATWFDASIYAVRTPKCSLASDQDVTFERYTPTTGVTDVIAHLPSGAADGGVKAIGAQLYVFSPQHPGITPVPVQRYDPASNTITALSSIFPGCTVDAPSFVQGTTITWTSNCVWSCQFIRYDGATDTWTTLNAKLPGTDGEIAKLGLVWDGTVAHILTFDHETQDMRFYDYNAPMDTIAAGAAVTLPSVAGPLLQTGPTTAIVGTWAGSSIVKMTSFDLATGAWLTQPGYLPGAPQVWGVGVGWVFEFPTGGVTCVTRIVLCPTAAPPPVIVDPNPVQPQPPENVPTPPHATAPIDRPTELDQDSDGIPDAADNCPATSNRDQADLDQNGIGDACDVDIDGDGSPNAADNCPMVANLGQDDLNGDGIGDACQAIDGEAHRLAVATAALAGESRDQDKDGIADSSDNCPAIPNPTQLDMDHDGIGDVCDADRDGDGIVQVSARAGVFLDNCPDTPNADQADADGNQVGDACSWPILAPTEPDVAAVPPMFKQSAPTVTPVSPLVAAGLGAAAVAAAAGVWNARKRWLPFLAPLFSRFVGKDVTIHPARARLIAAIEAQPGIHFNELARLVNQARGSVRHHLQILETAGLVKQVHSGRYSCLYLADVRHEPGNVVRKSEVARRLESMVRDHPGMTAADASRTLGVTYGAAAYHLRRMATAGLVRLEDKPLTAFPLPTQSAGPQQQS